MVNHKKHNESRSILRCRGAQHNEYMIFSQNTLRGHVELDQRFFNCFCEGDDPLGSVSSSQPPLGVASWWGGCYMLF